MRRQRCNIAPKLNRCRLIARSLHHERAARRMKRRNQIINDQIPVSFCWYAKPPVFSGRDNWWPRVAEGFQDSWRIAPKLRSRHYDLGATQLRVCPGVQDYAPCAWTGDVVLKF